MRKRKRRKLSEDELLRQAMAHHAESGRAWERDYGDRPVVDYLTGKIIAATAIEYRRRTKHDRP